MRRAGWWGALALTLTLAGAARADSWISTGGPLGGLGYDVRIHPTTKQTMFVTDNYAGVIKSVDSGKSWRPSNAGITVRGGPTGDAYTIFSLTIDPNDPNTLWAGTNGDGGAFGIFKSTDGGASWTQKNNGVTDNGFGIVFRGFTVQAGNSSVVYAQAELHTAVMGREFNRTDGRVYKTTDGGANWSLLWSGADLARYLIIDPTQPKTLYLSTGIFDREASNSNCAAGLTSSGGVGILKSVDGGATWNAINSGLTDLYVGALRMHPGNPQILFAATGNNACSGVYENNVVSGLFRTADGGAHWTKLLGGEIFTTVAFSPSSPDVVYAASANTVHRSADGGKTWTSYAKPTGDWGPAGVRAGVPIDVAVDPDDPDTLYANNYGGGVFASSDGARTWRIWSRGYSGAEIHALAIPDTRPGTVYAIGRSGPFVSPNHGLDWIGIGNGAANFPEWDSVAVQPGHPDVVLISDEHQGWMLRSSDGGASFAGVLHHPQADPSMRERRQGWKAIAFAPSDPTVVYAGLAKDRGTIDTSVPVGAVFYRSADAGQTFSSPGGDLDGKNVHRMLVDRQKATTAWAATSGGLWKTVDGGAHWTLLGLGNRNVLSVAVSASDPNTLVASAKDVGVFLSGDGGATWPGGPYNTGFSNPNPAVTALLFDGAALYAGDFYSGVYRSQDGGKTWSAFPDSAMTGLRMRAVKDLALAGGVLYAATQGGGVFRAGGPAVIPTPVDGDFGTIGVGASVTRAFTIYNTGAASRALMARALGGANAGDFAIRNDTCTASLATAASCTLEVVFTPPAAGPRTGTLNVTSDDPFAATYAVSLHGTATAPPPDAAIAVDAPVTVDVAPLADAGALDAPVAVGGSGGSVDAGAGGSTGGTGTGGSGGSGGLGETDQPDASVQPGTGTPAKSASKSGGGCSLGGRPSANILALLVLTATIVRRRRRKT